MAVGTSGPPKCIQCEEEIVLKIPPVQTCVYDDQFGYQYLPFCCFYHMMEWAEEHCQCARCKRIVNTDNMEDDDICKDCASGKAVAPAEGKKAAAVAQVASPFGTCTVCGCAFIEPVSSCPDCDTPVEGVPLGGG